MVYKVGSLKKYQILTFSAWQNILQFNLPTCAPKYEW